MQIIQTIQNRIYEIRGERVMLDFDLAQLYEVETKVLNQAVKRNIKRFPEDFMFQLTKEEFEALRFQIETLENADSIRSQIVTLENNTSLRSQFASLKTGSGRQPKYLPFAFTEHGVAMLASVLNSSKAIQVNISIIRAFIALREFALNFKELSDKILEMEKQFNMQFADVFEALDYLMEEKKIEVEQKERPRIGFKQ